MSSCLETLHAEIETKISALMNDLSAGRISSD